MVMPSDMPDEDHLAAALVDAARRTHPKMGVDELLIQCFRHFVNLDETNAATRCAPVWYSPITFRLAEQVFDRSMPFLVEGGMLWTQVYAVIDDAGRYPEDPGR